MNGGPASSACVHVALLLAAMEENDGFGFGGSQPANVGADDLESYMQNTPNAAEVSAKNRLEEDALLRKKKRCAIVGVLLLVLIVVASIAGVAGVLASSLQSENQDNGNNHTHTVAITETEILNDTSYLS